MNLFYLSWANLRSNTQSSFLAILLTAFGVATITLIFSLERELEKNFESNLRHTDMVIGAKGSPLQLVLANVYHIDQATGNIPLASVKPLSRHPLVRSSVKMAYGDYFKSYRIVGTEQNFLGFYELHIGNGKTWSLPFEVVVGSGIANREGLKVGDIFQGSHGSSDGDSHAHPYKISGILAPSGTVADHLVLTSLESVWNSHHNSDLGKADSLGGREITSLLIRFRSSMGIMVLPRMVNAMPHLQAALPSIEISRVLNLFGIGFAVLTALASLILIISAVSVFVTMLNAMKARRYELALMRVLGATPSALMAVILIETVLLSVFGSTIGLIAGKLIMWGIVSAVEDTFHYSLSVLVFGWKELVVIPFVIILGMLAGLPPAIKAYRIPIALTLIDE